MNRTQTSTKRVVFDLTEPEKEISEDNNITQSDLKMFKYQKDINIFWNQVIHYKVEIYKLIACLNRNYEIQTFVIDTLYKLIDKSFMLYIQYYNPEAFDKMVVQYEEEHNEELDNLSAGQREKIRVYIRNNLIKEMNETWPDKLYTCIMILYSQCRKDQRVNVLNELFIDRNNVLDKYCSTKIEFFKWYRETFPQNTQEQCE